jgi:hypothetical protein
MTDSRSWASPGSVAPETGRTPARTPEPAAPADQDAIEKEIPFRPLGVSEILDGSVTYIRRSPRAALGMSAALTVTVQVIITLVQYFLIGARARAEITPTAVQQTLGGGAVVFISGLLLTGLVVMLLGGLLAPVMARTLVGRSTSLDRAWHDARPNLRRLAGAAAAVVGAVLLGAVLPFAPVFLALVTHAPDSAMALAWVIAVPVSAVLTISAYVWFALATPILVLEQRGVFAALRRSAEIVRGHWWRTFGTLVLTLTITILAQFVVLPMPFVVVQKLVLSARPDPTGWTLVAFVAIGMVARIIAGTLLNPFNAGVMTLLYADRRMRREAFDLELQMEPPADPLTAWLPGPLTAAGSGRQPRMPRPGFIPPPGPQPGPPPGWRP